MGCVCVYIFHPECGFSIYCIVKALVLAIFRMTEHSNMHKFTDLKKNQYYLTKSETSHLVHFYYRSNQAGVGQVRKRKSFS